MNTNTVSKMQKFIASKLMEPKGHILDEAFITNFRLLKVDILEMYSSSRLLIDKCFIQVVQNKPPQDEWFALNTTIDNYMFQFCFYFCRRSIRLFSYRWQRHCTKCWSHNRFVTISSRNWSQSGLIMQIAHQWPPKNVCFSNILTFCKYLSFIQNNTYIDSLFVCFSQSMAKFIPKIGCYSLQTQILKIIFSHLKEPHGHVKALFMPLIKDEWFFTQFKSYNERSDLQKHIIMYRDLPNFLNRNSKHVYSKVMRYLYIDDEPIDPYPVEEHFS